MESTDTAFTHTHRALNAQPSRSASGGINVGDMERLASALGGAVLVLLALRRFHLATLFQGLLGSYLVYRGATGRCLVYQALGVSTAEKGLSESPSVPAPRGIRVEKSVTINCAPEEVYRFWRNFENLPRFMKHLESVTIVDDRRSHWVASGPAGSDVEWDAEILQDKENEMISWRSLGNSEVGNAGSVWFRPAPGGRGTEVRVEIEYDPPAGLLGALIARLFGEEPSEQVDEDLHRFKQVMEAGEILVTEGQPTGPRPFLPI